MHVIQARNVCEALPRGVDYLLREGIHEDSRAGPVLVSPVPVTTVYEQPTERCLFSATRDANPFFHLAEAVWMMAGRRDAAFLDLFVRDFGARFAEPDGMVHGAYGHRWRHNFDFDQLEAITGRLKYDPSDRQCVLAMWDAQADDPGEELLGANDLIGDWRDRPCNTHAYFRVREGALDMTVCCRSNDIIWGAYGANAVHFSVLQEYIATVLGVVVGRYYQVSNNYHVYQSELDRLSERAMGETSNELFNELLDNRYHTSKVPEPIVTDITFLDECVIIAQYVLSNWSLPASEWTGKLLLTNTWLRDTVHPACMAYKFWREGHKYQAIDTAHTVSSPDWRSACVEWFERRYVKDLKTEDVRSA